MFSSLDNIAYLPDDIWIDICSKVLALSPDPITDLTKLESVSTTLMRLCHHPCVLRNLPFHGSPFGGCYYPCGKSLKYFKLYKKCFQAGNPVVLYREGILKCFKDQQLQEGLQLLSDAATMGIEEAAFFYGVILLCLGGEGKKKGFEILSSFAKPLLENALHLLEETHRHCWLIDLMVTCQPMVKHLKSSYVREKCSCDCSKDGLAEQDGMWDRLIRERRCRRSIASSSCRICVCHHILQLFFDLTEE